MSIHCCSFGTEEQRGCNVVALEAEGACEVLCDWVISDLLVFGNAFTVVPYSMRPGQLLEPRSQPDVLLLGGMR